jgi:hypothetical protein
MSRRHRGTLSAGASRYVILTTFLNARLTNALLEAYAMPDMVDGELP